MAGECLACLVNPTYKCTICQTRFCTECNMIDFDSTPERTAECCTEVICAPCIKEGNCCKFCREKLPTSQKV